MAGTQYRGSEIKDVNQFLNDADGLESERALVGHFFVEDLSVFNDFCENS